MKMNVALLRVSTDMQEFNAQKIEIESYCFKNKIKIDKYIEEYNVSGYSTALEDRKGLMEIKDLAANGLIDKLVIFNLDRIGRSMELTIYLNFLTNAGVTIVSVTEGIIGNNSMDDKLLNSIKLWLAESESVKISARSRAGLMAKNKRGEYSGGDVNYGYKLENNNLVIDKEEAEVVKWIFNRYLEVGTVVLAWELNEKGIEKWNKGRKVKWSQNAVNRILKNSIYIGYKEYNKTVKVSADKTNKNRRLDLSKKQLQEYKEELHIVDTDLFNRVQQLNDERCLRSKNKKSTTRSKELLEGQVFHECGHKMHISYRYWNEKKAPIYKCKHCVINRITNVRKSIIARVLDDYVEIALKELLPRLDKEKLKENIENLNNSKFGDKDKEIKAIKEDIKRQEKIYNNATKELDKIFAGESALTTDIVSVKIGESKQKIMELKSRLAELEKVKAINSGINVDKMLQIYNSFYDVYKIASTERKKAMINEVIDKVVFYDPDKIEIIWKHFSF